jgi:hypothetical protein
LELSAKVLDLAWIGYFGAEPAPKRERDESGKEGRGDVRAEQQMENAS